MEWTSALAIIIYIVVGIGMIIAWAEIFLKAGYNRWLCFTMIVPVVNAVVFLWFAFAKWPIYEAVTDDWRRISLQKQRQKLDKELAQLTDQGQTQPTKAEAKTVPSSGETSEDEDKRFNDRLTTVLSLAVVGIIVLFSIILLIRC